MLGVPSPSDLEKWGETWRHASYEYLIGTAARQYGLDTSAALPAQIDSQRRLHEAIVAFDGRMVDHSQQLAHTVEESGRSTARLVDLTEQTSAQTAKVIALTETMKTLTEWITYLTFAAVLFGGIQAVAILVHFVRWYRGF
jgi:uncharacterized protein (DUF2126 family)